MKSFFIALVFLFSLNAFAGDMVYEFFAKQIEMEKKIKDHNISTSKIEELMDAQGEQYRKFVLKLIAKKNEFVEMNDPDIAKMAKLRRRMQINKQRGNRYAYLRDEVELKNYEIYRAMRKSLKEVVLATDVGSLGEFTNMVNDIITKRYNDITPLDMKKYQFSKEEIEASPILQKLKENIKTNMLLMQVNNTLSAELTENIDAIYNVVVLSGYGLFSMAHKVNNSAFGQILNPLLSYVALDAAKVVMIIFVILIIFVLRRIFILSVNRMLLLVVVRQSDADLILEGTSKIFNWMITAIMLHMILIIYAGFNDVEWLTKVFEIIYVVLIMFFLYRLFNAVAAIKIEDLNRTKILRNEVINLGLKAINVAIFIIGTIVILKIMGVDLTAILSGLGIGGFAVAFAAKDSIANIFGSISILMGDLFEQGDWIAIGDMEGTVVEIGLRGTTIRTFDNALISIPNFKLADNGIKNWSRRSMGRRIKMQIGVTYESDFADIKNAVNEIRTMLKEHPGIASEQTEYLSAERHARLVSREDLKGVKRTTLVYMDQFSASSIDILLYCFSRSVVWSEWLEVKEDVMYKIAEIMKKNNLSFAYPAMTIHQAQEQHKDESSTSEGIK
jgi:MscS family membrane protein